MSPVGVGRGRVPPSVAHGKVGWGEHGQGGPARCQKVQRRTWCWSSPTSPLAAWKDSSMRQRCSDHGGQGIQRHRLGCVAAVVGQFAGGVVAADEHMAVPRRCAVFTVPRPSGCTAIHNRSSGSAAPWSRPPRSKSASPRGQQPGQLVDSKPAARIVHAPLCAHRQHVAQAVLRIVARKPGSAPHLVAAHLVAAHPRPPRRRRG